jgi:TolB-like protein/class 3 adenylate cyclase/tetratricopeptide (TPR) repeat protein
VSETRKIAAILVADVVGYSRLAGADEEGTLARLRALRSDLIDPSIALHHGRVVKRTGDGIIIEFRSVVDAVRCAIEVQTGMVERNADLLPERRIEFRVGVHLGDVVEENDGDLMGDGVNIAARLEGLSDPGGLCLSGAAYEQVRDRLKESFADLGDKQLKNIARPVRVYGLTASAIAAGKSGIASPAPATRVSGLSSRWPALAAALVLALLAAGAFAWRAGYAPRFMAATVDDKLANAPRLSIVVLPFENLSGDKEQDYFVDGVTDDLTTDLSHLADSFVIARNTAFTYKGKAVDAKQIGRELGVRYVMEGSVRRVGETVTVNAQLISTETGAHVWADRFDGERSHLGELQVEIVARLANSLNVELIRAESLRALRERPKNPDAADLTMRGWAAFYKPTSKSNYDDAIEYFERALRIDPQLPQALIGLSIMLATEVSLGFSTNPAEDTARADALASQALLANPDNARAHDAKASSLLAEKQWDGAIAEEQAAIALNPNDPYAHFKAGSAKRYIGRAAEGLSGIQTALRLSPHDPFHWVWESSACALHAHLAQWDQAIEWCRKSITSLPKYFTYATLAAANAWAGHDTDARAAVTELLKLKPGYTVQQFADRANRMSDNPTYLRELQPIIEGLRKAGVPEGDKKTD